MRGGQKSLDKRVHVSSTRRSSLLSRVGTRPQKEGVDWDPRTSWDSGFVLERQGLGLDHRFGSRQGVSGPGASDLTLKTRKGWRSGPSPRSGVGIGSVGRTVTVSSTVSGRPRRGTDPSTTGPLTRSLDPGVLQNRSGPTSPDVSILNRPRPSSLQSHRSHMVRGSKRKERKEVGTQGQW